MDKRINKNMSGFTLMEVIIAMSLGILTGLMIIAIITPGLRYVRTVKRIEHLHSNAIFLLNKFDYWIKQGGDLEVVNPSTLEIKFPDNSTKELTKNGENITFDGLVFNADDIEVTELNFNKLNRSVRVNFTLQIEGTDEIFSATTTIAQRNGF